MRTTQRRGFTLIELLVVVAVVALLAGIMLPAVARTRTTAQRISCMSNLRQVHQMLAVYAHRHDGEVPIGYRGGHKQWNSMIYSASAQKFVLFGWLYDEGLMESPEIFYCPSESSPRSRFDSDENPWPPGPEGDPTSHTFCGYGCRPDHELLDDREEYDHSWRRLPRLEEFGTGAILADLTATPSRLDTRHRTGVNALKADGSVGWVERDRFDEPLQASEAISVESNPHQDAIWRVLDRARR